MPHPASHQEYQTQSERCAADCGAIAVERNRYFTGKYMAARDFRDEQAYFNSHRLLHNRLLHGWGIVCGLDVYHHPDWNQRGDNGGLTDCARRWVVIRAGLALDCCGREIIVQRDIYYELDHLKRQELRPPDDTAPDAPPGPPSGSQTQDEEAKAAYAARQRRHDQNRRFLLGIRYDEQLVEYAPALYSEEACDPKRVEANRVQEGWRLGEYPYRPTLRATCWADFTHNPEPTYFDDCGPQQGGSDQSNCLFRECPCPDNMVPLALIEYNPDDPDAGFEIDMLGRRHVRATRDVLTHITATNWRHGGTMRLSELRDIHNGQLRVTFDRDLYDPTASGAPDYYQDYPDAIGVNEKTFVVQYHRYVDATYTPLTLWNDETPPRIEQGRVAVFTIAEESLGGRAAIGGGVLHITLRCDFILDCHGRPVDGNHLRGRLRTGDGIQGGAFESWVTIEDDLPPRGRGRRSQGGQQSPRPAAARPPQGPEAGGEEVE